jgi:hypothetical protein
MKGRIQPSNNHAAVTARIMHPHAKLWFGSKEKLRNYIQNGAPSKNWSASKVQQTAHLRINAFFLCNTCFFPAAAHVPDFFGPETPPFRPRYGPDTATGVHFSKNSTAKGWHCLKK